MTGLKVWNSATQTESELAKDGLFVAIGRVPNVDLFKAWIRLNDHGYVQVQEGSTKTNIEGVFAAGDVIDWRYRQAVVAAGSGCMAALDAERFLAERGTE
jgi:thioredoxin reductase (NADPH)